MLPRSFLPGTLPVEKENVLMSSPFLSPPPKVVGSPAPQAVVSPDSGSTAKVVEMMLASAAAAGVKVGGLGGAPAAPGLPQLKIPRIPSRLTAPGEPGHAFGAPVPEL